MITYSKFIRIWFRYVPVWMITVVSVVVIFIVPLFLIVLFSFMSVKYCESDTGDKTTEMSFP